MPEIRSSLFPSMFQVSTSDLDNALDYCLENNISKAMDFEPVVQTLSGSIWKMFPVKEQRRQP